MPSPFAADRLPDGRRRYSHRAVVARRTLLGGIVLAGTGAAAGIGRLHHGTAADAAAGEGAAGSDPAFADTAVVDVAATPTATPSAPAFSTSDAASPWVVINKKHPITPEDYVPASLSTVGGKQVAGVVVPDLTALLAAAEGNGVRITLTSGYRSLGYQRGVHERAVERDGFAVAESLSARPGYSEHQTGLAIDFGSSTAPGCAVQDCYEGTPEARWLAERAGEFGFLLRYTAQHTDVTGYAPESWHYRWVGVDLVRQMAERGVATLEEFFGVAGGPDYS